MDLWLRLLWQRGRFSQSNQVLALSLCTFLINSRRANNTSFMWTKYLSIRYIWFELTLLYTGFHPFTMSGDLGKSWVECSIHPRCSWLLTTTTEWSPSTLSSFLRYAPSHLHNSFHRTYTYKQVKLSNKVHIDEENNETLLTDTGVYQHEINSSVFQLVYRLSSIHFAWAWRRSLRQIRSLHALTEKPDMEPADLRRRRWVPMIIVFACIPEFHPSPS